MRVFILQQYADIEYIGVAGLYKSHDEARDSALLRGATYNNMGVLCSDDYVYEIVDEVLN
jgi:hypothetical protein